MATKNTEIPVFIPEGFPDYLSFKPESDTISAHDELMRQLEAFGRKLETSNHLQAHQLGTQHLLPLMQLFYTWVTAAQRDQLIHTHHLAAYMQEQQDRPDYMSEETVDRFDAFFDAVQALIGLLKPLVTNGVESLTKLDEAGVTSLLALAKAKVEIVETHLSPLADVISEYAAPLDEEDAEEAEEDEESAPDDDEDVTATADDEGTDTQTSLFG